MKQLFKKSNNIEFKFCMKINRQMELNLTKGNRARRGFGKALLLMSAKPSYWQRKCMQVIHTHMDNYKYNSKLEETVSNICWVCQM